MHKPTDDTPNAAVNPLGEVYFDASAKEFVTQVVLNKVTRFRLLLGPDKLAAESANLDARRMLGLGMKPRAAQAYSDRRLGIKRPLPVATCEDVWHANRKAPYDKSRATADFFGTTALSFVDDVIRHRCDLPRVSRKGIPAVPKNYQISGCPITVIDAQFVPDLEAVHLGGLDPRSDEYRKACGTFVVRLSQLRGWLREQTRNQCELDGAWVPPVHLYLDDGSSLKSEGAPLISGDMEAIKASFRVLDRADAEDELLFLVLAGAELYGLRRSDLVLVHRDQVQAEGPSLKLAEWTEQNPDGTVTVNRTKNGKGRTVKIDYWYYCRLLAWFAEHPDCPTLIPGDRNARLDFCEEANDWLGREPELLKVLHRLHALRGFCAGFLQTELKDSRLVIRMLGHGSICTTVEYYAEHALPDDICRLFRHRYSCLPAHRRILPPSAGGEV